VPGPSFLKRRARDDPEQVAVLVLSVGAGPHPTIVAIGKRRKCGQTRKRAAHCRGPRFGTWIGWR
jgi:hypothetical protein